MYASTVERNGGRDASLAAYLEEIGRTPLLSASEEVDLAQRIDAGRSALHRLDTGAFSEDERAELESAVRRGTRARNRFLEANLRLVVSVARRYRNNGIDLLDLIQEGNLGLVRAVEKFDWRKGFKFSTYATWWIRQAISRALLEKGRSIRVPARVHDAALAVNGFTARFLAEHGRSPTIDETAEGSGIERELVEEVGKSVAVSSLDDPVGEDGAVIGDFVELVEAEAPDGAVEAQAVSNDLRRAVGRLSAREQLILSKRFGFEDGVPRTLGEVGEILGVTAARVGQLEKLALCRLRHPAFGLREGDLL
jgi:RNA polymerase sigma factor (sigma-70 family)